MSKHEHHCQHDFAFCQPCNVVYCKRCGAEWGAGGTTFVYPMNPAPWYPSWTTGTTTSFTNTASNSHR